MSTFTTRFIDGWPGIVRQCEKLDANASLYPGKGHYLLRMEKASLYYHICSDGRSVSVLFRNQSDFKAAMNRVAICTLRLKVVILAFVLMDNHFHFILRTRCEDDAIAFANAFKRLTGKYNADVYNKRASLSRLPVKVIPVEDADYLKMLIGYVVKNPTKARLDMYYLYPWGTGNLYFRHKTFGDTDGGDGQYDNRQPGGICRVADLGLNEIRKLCRTRVSLPDWWLINEGVILPENYVAVSEVEQLLKTTRSYLYFLSMNKDDDIDRDLGDWNELRLNDSELRSARCEIALALYGTGNIRDLSAPQRLAVAKQLRRKYLCSKRQLARIVMLPYEDLATHI